jgi:hypothetical protein
MFKRKPKAQSENTTPEGQPAPKGKPNWLKISVIANIAVLVIGVGLAAGGFMLYQSNTNPQMCATCHLMQSHVTSYLTGKNLDSVHAKAGVQCKDCHDYPVQAEITSGIAYITGNYEVVQTDPVTGKAEPALARRKFKETMCTKCHISLEHVATLTDFLPRNPHDSHNGALPCNTCHVSHGQQIDYCAQCHDNGGQRMIGAPIQPRGTVGGAN